MARWARQVASAGAATRSELALHGLAYLGVALTFVGALGFVLFAYHSVSPALRTAALLVIPAVFFGAAALLYKRGTLLVPASLEILAGAVTPVMLFAAFGDMHGYAATLIRIAIGLALTGAYSAVCTRRPTAPLRYLVAPMVWVTAWAVGLLFRVDSYSAAQVALTAGAVTMTLAIARLRAGHRLAHPTRVAAWFGIAITGSLALVFTVSEGGPPLPVALIGLAAVISVNLAVDRRRGGASISYVETLLAAATLGQLIPGWGVAHVGVLSVLVALLLIEWQERRRSDAVAVTLLAALAIAGLMLSLSDATAALAGGAAATIWCHTRRLTPTPSMRRLCATPAGRILLAGIAAAIPLVPAAALLQLLPVARGLLVIAAVLLAGTTAVRRFLQRDILYDLWLPAAGAAISGATGAMSTAVSPELAAAAVLAALTIAFAPAWPRVRVWSGSAALAWSLYLILATAGHSALWPPLLAAVGAGAVGASVFRRDPVAGHLTLAGLLSTAAALGLAADPTPRVVAMAAFTASWLLVVIAYERGASSLTAMVRHTVGSGRWVRVAVALPQNALTASLPFLAVLAGSDAGVFSGRRSLIGIVDALIAVGYAVAAQRLRKRRPLAPVLALATVVLSIVGIAVATPDLWPSIVAVSASIAGIAVMGGELRRPFMTWTAWALSIALVLLLSQAAGVSMADLPKITFDAGATFLIGGLLLDDVLSGRRQPGVGLRVSWLMKPVTVGALALPTGLAFIFGDGPAVLGWWALAAAAVYLAVAVQLRVGSVSALTYALAAFAIADLTDLAPFDHPAFLVPLAAVLVAIAWIAARFSRQSDPWMRWDIAPLVVAHLVAGVALARMLAVGMTGPTCLGLAGLALFTAAWRRALGWTIAGVVLALIGAAVEGPGAMALALYGACACAAFEATRRSGPTQILLRWTGAGTFAAAWIQTVLWAAWGLDVAVSVTSIASGVGTVLMASMVRRGANFAGWGEPLAALLGIGVLVSAGIASVAAVRPSALPAAAALVLLLIACELAAGPLKSQALRIASPLALAWAWGLALFAMRWTVDQQVVSTALASGVVAVAVSVLLRARRACMSAAVAAWTVLSVVGVSFAVIASPAGNAPHLEALAIGGCLALQAGAAGVAAKPLGWKALRDIGALLAAASGAALVYAAQLSVAANTTFVAASGLAALLLSLLVWSIEPRSEWLRPLTLLAAIADTGAVLLAASLLPSRGPLSLTLLVGAAEAAAAGLTLRRGWLLCTAPALLSGAWLLFASAALAGNPEWLTVPTGLAVLLTVELGRWDRRRRHLGPTSDALTALELPGMALVVASALIQSITDSSLYGVLAIGLGALLAAWGATTRVRRRVFTGSLAILMALVLILAVPVVRLFPEVTNVSLWVMLGGIGLLFLLVATTIEQSRVRVRMTVRRLGELMSGWE